MVSTQAADSDPLSSHREVYLQALLLTARVMRRTATDAGTPPHRSAPLRLHDQAIGAKRPFLVPLNPNGLACAPGPVFVPVQIQWNQLALAELNRIGTPALVLSLDVTDRAALAPTVVEVERALGGIDILINNANIVALTGGVLYETADIWDTTVETRSEGRYRSANQVPRDRIGTS